jgi:rare lipoprotein A
MCTKSRFWQKLCRGASTSRLKPDREYRPMSLQRSTITGLAFGVFCFAGAVHAESSQLRLDRSGALQRGRAAVSGQHLVGRQMADGGRLEAASDSVASATLPLGTTACVKNQRNGRTTMVRVRDRLPQTGGRILSVSPRVAGLLGMSRTGIAFVEVAPLAVPQSDGSIRLGSGTGMAGRRAYSTDRRERQQR